MNFEIISAITNVKIIKATNGICEIARLRKDYGGSRWRKMKASPQFAVCVNNDGYAVSLERHKIYRVLPDLEALEDHELRVIDESGEDYLFSRDWFMLVELPETLKKSLLA